jgi:hypothetical protein
MRSSTWVTAGFAQKYAGPNGENIRCTSLLAYFCHSLSLNIHCLLDPDEEKRSWKENSGKYLEYRKDVEREFNANFNSVIYT